MNKTFAEILNEKIEPTPRENTPLTDTEPQNLAFLIAQMPRFRSLLSKKQKEGFFQKYRAVTSQYANSQGESPDDSTSTRSEESPVTDPVPPVEIIEEEDHYISRPLTDREKKALDFFNHYQETTLSENFGHRQMKKIFRKLAKKFHPDAHQDLGELALSQKTKLFRELREAYQVLNKAF